ncbi:hypothetical protein [Nocardia nova]
MVESSWAAEAPGWILSKPSATLGYLEQGGWYALARSTTAGAVVER